MYIIFDFIHQNSHSHDRIIKIIYTMPIFIAKKNTKFIFPCLISVEEKLQESKKKNGRKLSFDRNVFNIFKNNTVNRNIIIQTNCIVTCAHHF